MSTQYLACDLGAESGRIMAATLAQGRLSLETLHRFPNRAFQKDETLQWDFPALLRELQTGLALAATEAHRRQQPFLSISTDSWGVDYVLLDAEARFLAPA